MLQPVRRVALLCLIPISAMIAVSCNDDGRTLREPGPDQNQSISSLGTTPGSDVVDTVVETTTAQTAGPDTTEPAGDLGSLPLGDEELVLTAPWTDGESIDPRFTCDGDNIAPGLLWTAAPEGTVEIAVTLRDVQVPTFAHWTIAGIAPDATSLDEDTAPIGAYEATNGLGAIGYTGPCPPAGSTHTYALTVHYLDAETNLTDGVASGELVDVITAAEIASVEVDGTFSRG
jgi:Raf kinase inhibitor-like YbhB/YbcL family protein